MRVLKRSPSEGGFTLVELVVVLAILVALAGLVISKVDFLRRQATMATAAAASGDVANNIELYMTTNSALPNGLDSLIDDSTGKLYAPLIGTTDNVGNLPADLVVSAVANVTGDKRLNSLVRMGLTVVNDQSDTSTNATDSGTTGRLLVAGTGITPTEPITPLATANLALVSGSTSAGASLWKAVYPANVWGTAFVDGADTEKSIDQLGNFVSLVALGVGPGNSLIGSTMTTPPQMAGPDSNLYYYRYVAIFAVYSDGRRAQLKTVLDSFGRTVDGDLSNYGSAGPDDIPAGSRTPE